MNDINTLEEKMAEACKKGTNAGRSHLPLPYLDLISKIRRQDEIIYKVAISFKIFMSSEPLKTWCLQQKIPLQKFFSIFPFTYNGNKLKVIGLMFTNPLNIYYLLS